MDDFLKNNHIFIAIYSVTTITTGNTILKRKTKKKTNDHVALLIS